MKKSLMVLILGFVVKISSAQKEQLSFDEHDKYIYYQVADMPGLTKDTLIARELNFLKASYPKMKIKPIVNSNQIIADGKFLVYDGTSILRHESGQIAYVLTIESKDQKYRYWLTGLLLHPTNGTGTATSCRSRGQKYPLRKLQQNSIKKTRTAALTKPPIFAGSLAKS